MSDPPLVAAGRPPSRWEQEAAEHVGAKSSLAGPAPGEKRQRRAAAGQGKGFKRAGWAAQDDPPEKPAAKKRASGKRKVAGEAAATAAAAAAAAEPEVAEVAAAPATAGASASAAGWEAEEADAKSAKKQPRQLFPEAGGPSAATAETAGSNQRAARDAALAPRRSSGLRASHSTSEATVTTSSGVSPRSAAWARRASVQNRS